MDELKDIGIFCIGIALVLAVLIGGIGSCSIKSDRQTYEAQNKCLERASALECKSLIKGDI